MCGWIAISRDLFKHEFFAREPMSEREAWVWMIAKAAWKDTRHKVAGEMTDVPRGSFFCTLRELQHAWGWQSDKRVRTFLKRTQAERMVDVRTDARKTQITICNYDEYQAIGRKEDASGTQAPTQSGRTKETRNNLTSEQEKDLGPDGQGELLPLAVIHAFPKQEAPATEEPPPKKPKRRPEVPIPEGWVPSDRNIADAHDAGFSDQEIQHEAHQFYNRHTAKGTTFRDWDAAWRTWLGNARKFASPRGMAGPAVASRGGQGSSLASIAARRRASGEV